MQRCPGLSGARASGCARVPELSDVCRVDQRQGGRLGDCESSPLSTENSVHWQDRLDTCEHLYFNALHAQQDGACEGYIQGQGCVQPHHFPGLDSPCALLSGTKQLTHGHAVQAPDVPKGRTDRGPVAVTCVVDRSGSMRGEPLDLVKRSVAYISSQILSFDFFGLVSYSSDARSPTR